MKRLLFSIAYWSVSTIMLSLILLSSGYNFGQAFLTACAILPGALMVKYLGRTISFKKTSDGIKSAVFLTLAVLVTTYLFIFCVHWYLLKVDTKALLMNPFFLLLIVASYTALNIFIENRLFKSTFKELEKCIEFTSNRKKISLELPSIKYIESNDSEVWVRTIDGRSFRTKMKISRWNDVLDDRFIRVHRSFLVNKDLVTRREADCVYLGDEKIPISRKYHSLPQRFL